MSSLIYAFIGHRCKGVLSFNKNYRKRTSDVGDLVPSHSLRYCVQPCVPKVPREPKMVFLHC